MNKISPQNCTGFARLPILKNKDFEDDKIIKKGDSDCRDLYVILYELTCRDFYV